MEILNEYGAVNYFGIQTFSVGIFKYWFSMDDKSTAIIFSVFLLIIVLFLITTLKYLKRHDKRIKYHIKTSPFVYPKQHSRKIVNYTLICIPILFGLFIPIIFILNNIKSNFHKYDLIELSHVFKNTFTCVFQ